VTFTFIYMRESGGVRRAGRVGQRGILKKEVTAF
jgi:hypothetical protein